MLTCLFDIDGTLLRSGGAGLHAMRVALSTVFAVESLPSVEVRGRTDRAIIGDIFALCGIDHSEQNWHRFQQTYLKELPKYMRSGRGRLLPGVESSLAALQQDSGVAVGLLTGNMEAAAKIKLSHFAIDHCFAFGGFGDVSTCRNEVARCAVRAAVAHLNDRFQEDRVFVIGDTPLDIECGRAIGATTIAVLTGGFDRAELTRAAPDLLLDDLSDLPQQIAAIC